MIVTQLNNNARIDMLQAQGGEFTVGVRRTMFRRAGKRTLHFSMGDEDRTHQLEILYYP